MSTKLQSYAVAFKLQIQFAEIVHSLHSINCGIQHGLRLAISKCHRDSPRWHLSTQSIFQNSLLKDPPLICPVVIFPLIHERAVGGRKSGVFQYQAATLIDKGIGPILVWSHRPMLI